MEKIGFMMPNGLDVVVCMDKSLPVVEIHGWVKNGFAPDAKNDLLRSLTTSMMKRGTKARSKKEFEDALDGHALKYSVGLSSFSGFFAEFNSRLLNSRVKELLELICESLRYPSFPESELALLKLQLEAGWMREQDNTHFRACFGATRMMYGPSHYHFVLDVTEIIEVLNACTRDDILEFWQKHYVPSNCGIVVVGDVEADAVGRAMEEAFGTWSEENSREGANCDHPDTAALSDCGTDEYEESVVFLPGKANAVFWAGHSLGINSIHSDYPALRIAVKILGGGMHSRLFQHVREKSGLSYSVWASLEGMNIIPGYFYMSADTNPENIQKTQEEALKMLVDFCENGVRQEEIECEKAVWRGAGARSRSSFQGIAQEIIAEKIIGRTQKSLNERVYALSVDEVNMAIAKYINPSRMKVVRAGTVS